MRGKPRNNTPHPHPVSPPKGTPPRKDRALLSQDPTVCQTINPEPAAGTPFQNTLPEGRTNVLKNRRAHPGTYSLIFHP